MPTSYPNFPKSVHKHVHIANESLERQTLNIVNEKRRLLAPLHAWAPTIASATIGDSTRIRSATIHEFKGVAGDRSAD